MGRLWIRWLGVAAMWVVVGAVVGVGIATTLPSAFGYKTLTILSGSMEPALSTGDVVIDEVITAKSAHPGDVLTFPDPEDHGRLLTHRLKSIRVEGPKAYMVTIGDANDAPERWNVSRDAELGRVAYRIPAVGYVRSWIGERFVRLGLLALVGFLGLWMLLDIWRPRPSPQPD